MVLPAVYSHVVFIVHHPYTAGGLHCSCLVVFRHQHLTNTSIDGNYMFIIRLRPINPATKFTADGMSQSHVVIYFCVFVCICYLYLH